MVEMNFLKLSNKVYSASFNQLHCVSIMMHLNLHIQVSFFPQQRLQSSTSITNVPSSTFNAPLPHPNHSEGVKTLCQENPDLD